MKTSFFLIEVIEMNKFDLDLIDQDLIDFEYKKLEKDLFLISESNKKSVVSLNEIFSISDRQYVFVSNFYPVSLLFTNLSFHNPLILVADTKNKLRNFFFHKDFLINLFSFIFSVLRKKSKLFFMIFLIFILPFFLGSNKISKENMISEEKKYLLKSKLYFGYKNIVKNALPLQEEIIIEDHNKEELKSRKFSKIKMLVKKEGFLKKNKKKKLSFQEKIDPDVRYFLNMKKKK